MRDGLGLDLPPVEVDLGGLGHPLVVEADGSRRRHRGAERILAIVPPLVYRMCHAAWRGTTRLEADERRFWVCPSALRDEGSGEDAYEVFAALQRVPAGCCPTPTIT